MSIEQPELGHGDVIFDQAIPPQAANDDYGPLVSQLQDMLERAGIDRARRSSVKNIVLEYLMNIELHSKAAHGVAGHPRLEVRKKDDDITVAMEGTASGRDIERMKRIVTALSSKSNAELWDECRRRSFRAPAFETPGAGLGLLVIAALSSRENLRMTSWQCGNVQQFRIQSGL